MDQVSYWPHHEHEIDGKLHEDCAMCDEIRARMPSVKREQSAESALAAHQKRAERSKIGRDALKEQVE
jgi:hypothetical protein